MKPTSFLQRINHPIFFSLLFFVLLVSVTPHAFAATKYWIGSDGGAFATAANWSLTSGGAPTSAAPIYGDTAVFNSAGNTNASIAASMTGSSIEIRDGYTKNITLSSNVKLVLNTLNIGSSSARVVLGTGSKLKLYGNGTPLTGTGTLDTSTNTPNTVEFLGQGTTNIAAAGPVASGYHHLTVDPVGFSRENAITLNAGEGWIASSIRQAIDGYAYIGLGGGRIDKIRLSDFTEVASLSTGHAMMGAAFAVGGYAYFADDSNPAHVLKVRLSDFTLTGSALSLGFTGSDSINGVTDGTYGYFGLNTDPGKIARVLLSNLTLVDTLTLAAGENPQSSVIDTVNGYAYFGTWSSPGKIVKVRLSDFTRVGSLTLSAGESYLDRDADIDMVNGYAYFTTQQVSGLARVVIVRLSDFTEMPPFYFDAGDSDSSTIAIDSTNGIGYFAANNAPGRLFKVRLSDWTSLGKITLKTGENYPWRGHTIDNGSLYLAGNASPGIFVRINMGYTPTYNLGTAASQTLAVRGDLALGDGTNAVTFAGSTYNPTTSITGNATINTNATLIAPSALSLAGNWTNRGTFTANGGSVTLNGSNQSLSGSTTFTNLIKTVSAADTLTIAANTLQRITGTLTFRGLAGALLSLRSSLAGIQWQIDPQEIRDIQYSSVQDSLNSNVTTIRATGSTDAGNNNGWTFIAAASSSSSPSSEGGSRGGGGFGSRSLRPTVDLVHREIDVVSHTGESSNNNVTETDVLQEQNYFKDVSHTAWYGEAVYALEKLHVVSGFKDGNGNPTRMFKPADPVTYAQFAKMSLLIRDIISGKPMDLSIDPNNDSAKNTWAASYIAEAEKLFSLYQKSLNVHEPMPRGATAQTLLELLNISPSLSNHTFSDLPSSHPYFQALMKAVSINLFSGDDNTNTMRPDGALSRAEAAKLIDYVLRNSESLRSSAPRPAQEEQMPKVEAALAVGIHMISRPILFLLAQPSIDSSVIKILRRNEFIYVLANSGTWAEVERKDGLHGFVYNDSLLPLHTNAWPDPTMHRTIKPIVNLRGGPFIQSLVRAELPQGTIVWVLEEIDVWSKVVTEDGKQGYIATSMLK